MNHNIENKNEQSKITHNITLDELIAINAKVRDIDPDIHYLDGAGQINETSMTFNVLAYLPPLPENRRQLIEDILENAELIEDKESKATYIGICINAIHPFNDGNGRTSRYAYFRTLSDGKIPQNIEEKILRNSEGRKIVDLNPQRIHIRKLFNNYIEKIIINEIEKDLTMPDRICGGFYADFVDDYSYENVIAPPESTREMRQALYEIFTDRYCGLATIVRSLMATNREELLIVFTKQTPNNGSFLNLDELARELTVDDISLLYDTHVRMRDEYIKFLQKIFTLPEYANLSKEITRFYRPNLPEDSMI